MHDEKKTVVKTSNDPIGHYALRKSEVVTILQALTESLQLAVEHEDDDRVQSLSPLIRELAFTL